MTDLSDPLPLAQALIRCASVTPADAGAQAVLGDALKQLGFAVTSLRYGEIENLFARIGTGAPHICFAGHTDVVPVGAANWQSRSVRRRGAQRRAVRPRRLRHEGRHRRLRRRRRAASGGRRAARLDQPADHRRRGRPRGRWHGARAGVDAGQRPDPRLLHRRRADLSGEARRHGEDRPARQPEREDHRARHAGPRRLSASRRQSGAPAGARRRGADRRTARRRQRLVRAVQPAVHQHRRRQHGDQRDPGLGQRRC